MQFLSDLFVRCAECEGKRFQSHVLKVRLHDKSIHDILQLTVSEAIEFFDRLGEQKIDEAPSPQSSQHSSRVAIPWEADAKRQVRVDPGIQISNGLKVLEEVGLGYLRLGQPLNTLSGGESQRLKLVGHLAETKNVQPGSALDGLRRGEHPTPMNREQAAQRPNGEAIGNLFIFDEPTTGLHFDDVAMLLQLFQRLVDRGHSICGNRAQS